MTSSDLDSQSARAILEHRAQVLARGIHAGPAVPEQMLEAVTFRLSGEHYAIEAAYVRRVIPFVDFTPLPDAPPFLIGVMNLSGDILAVIDLRQMLGLHVKGLTDLARLIIFGKEQDEFGILADATEELIKIPLSSLVAMPSTAEVKSHKYIRATTRDALIILDGHALLTDPYLHIDQSDY